jgi:hypothetical protein
MESAIAWWAQLYRTNDIVQILAAFGHILSIAYAARFALAGDRAALRLTRATYAVASPIASAAPRTRSRAADLNTLTSAHRHVLTGLACALVTGLAQLAAQLDYLPQSPIFWVKMTLLVVLLANGRVIQLAGRRAVHAASSSGIPDELRPAALRSIALWCTLILLGLLLTTILPVA